MAGKSVQFVGRVFDPKRTLAVCWAFAGLAPLESAVFSRRTFMHEGRITTPDYRLLRSGSSLDFRFFYELAEYWAIRPPVSV